MKWGEKEEKRFHVIQQIKKKSSQTMELVRDLDTDCICIKHIFFEDKREIYENLADIHSAFLPKIYAVYFDENTTVLEEYVKGSRLDEYIKQHTLSKKEIKTFFIQLCDGISHLHEKGIVHRDIKPSNIIVSDKGSLVLIDFDIARIYREDNASDTQSFGTRGYAAPEQFGFSQSDSRTDIFALGKTMQYLMECNQYQGYLCGIVDRCIAFDPEKRYQTIQAVKKNIQRKRVPYIFIIFCIVLCLTGGIAMYVKGFLYDNMPKDKTQTEKATKDNLQSDMEDREDVLHLISLQQSCEYTLLSNGQKKEIVYEKFRGKQNLTMNVSMQTHCLQVSCQMEGETFERRLSFDVSDSKNYQDTKVDGEVLFVDMNQDGAKEILLVLSDRIVRKGSNNAILQNTNGVQIWCLGWDEEFFLAKNNLFSFDGNFTFGNLCDYGIYSGDDMSLYVLSNQNIVSIEEQQW